MHTVAFTTRQQADFLLLVAALEVESAAIGAGVHFGIAKLDDLGPARNGLPNVVIRVQVIARLVNIGQINGIPQLDRAGIGLFVAGDHLEQGRFTRAVGADHADDPARRQREVQLFDQQLVAHGFGQTLDLKHLVAQTGTVGDNDLGTSQAFALRAVGHFVIRLDPRFGFRLTGLGPLTHPFQFARQCLLLGLVLAGFLFKPFGFLVDPAGIVPLVGDAIAAVELEDPAGDVIQEVPVVGDDQDRALIVDQVLLQPSDGFRVQVVGRFVKQQHFGRFQQQLAQRHAAGFTTGQFGHIGIVGRAAQGFHRDVDLAVEIPEVLRVDLILQGGHFVGCLVGIVHRQFVVAVQNVLLGFHAQHDILAHGQGRVQIGFLFQVADLGPFSDPCFARVILVLTGHDLHQRGFTRTVDADHTDFHTGQEVQVNVVETLFAARVGL